MDWNGEIEIVEALTTILELQTSPEPKLKAAELMGDRNVDGTISQSGRCKQGTQYNGYVHLAVFIDDLVTKYLLLENR